VSQKRKSRPLAGAPAAPESSPTARGEPDATPEQKDEAAGSLPWKLAGIGLFLVALLTGTAVYMHLQRQVRDLRNELGQLGTDLRKDLARLHESYGTMVKKHDHDGRVRQVWDALKELRADRSDLTILKERCAALLERLKAGDEERRQIAGEVRHLREGKAGEDERQALAREIRAIRERMAQLEGGKAVVVPAGHAEEQYKE
jgi:hypothetical protein